MESTVGGGIRYEARDGVGYVTLAAPPLNILTAAMMNGISGALRTAHEDPALQAVAFRAEGKAFSAGADVGEHSPEQAPTMIASFTRMFQYFRELEIPVAMAVGGAALGAGFELTMMADILISSRTAKFGQPEIRLGFVPPVGVSRLPSLVGPAKATEIVCTGRTYSAEEMLACGFVSELVEPEALEETLEARLDELRRASPLIMRMNVRLLKASETCDFEGALHAANRVFLEELMATEDVREGIASFFEKRPPSWKNR